MTSSAVDHPSIPRSVIRVYLYWREQGFSPEDARLMVGSFILSVSQSVR
jgi:hypothetical protein